MINPSYETEEGSLPAEIYVPSTLDIEFTPRCDYSCPGLELRADELRFTAEESDSFLERVVGLSLSPEEIHVLEDRMEGWIAGLQLAALSMQGRKDIRGFIQAFSGSHRFILDYLVEEVINRQP
jgi:ATP/maltotriose-dependent transcriptional regulator MalT